MTTAAMPHTVEQACYTAADLTRVLSISLRHVWRLSDAGKLPASIRLGKLVRWPKLLIDEWLAAGCPARPRAHR